MGLYDKLKSSELSVHGVAAKIMVVGVGGAGGNAVDHIYEQGIKGVNLMICNTDIKALDKSPLSDSQKICMGDGKGAGNDAETGRKKATEAMPEIREYVESHNPDMIFLAAGMGGGTGTGATPVIAQMIHSLDIPVIAILTTPPQNEGSHRFEQAAAGIESMKEFVDTFIIIKNETIIELYQHLSVREAFNKANDVVAYAAKGIAEIALTQSDLVSVDISDVCKVIRHSRCAVMGMAESSGEHRTIKAIDKAILSPLFGGAPITGATDVLVNFATSSPDGLIMSEVNEALNHVQALATTVDDKGNEQRANVIWGTSVKPELGDNLEIIIVVAGFPANSFYSNSFSGKLTIAAAEAEESVVEENIVEQSAAESENSSEIEVKTEPTEVKNEAVAEVVETQSDVKDTTPLQQPQPIKVETPKVVEPVKPQPQPQPVKPQPVKPQVVVPVNTVVGQSIDAETEAEAEDRSSWYSVMPPRQGVKTIPINQRFPAHIIKSKSRPAYATRRMHLLTEVVGRSKKIGGKADDTEQSREVIDASSQSFDF